MAWFARGRQRTTSGAATGGRFLFLGGRRHVADAPYVLPKDDKEIQRLDFQHYLLRFAMRGNYAAPIAHPSSILDVGCGTGRWPIEMAEQFPNANVVGVDIVPPPTEAERPDRANRRPDNFAFIQGNILQGLPFANNTFDFVHMRLLVFALPASRWQDVANELARVTRPDGWVEWMEGAILLHGGGPAVERLNGYASAAGKGRGIEPMYGYRIGDFLQEAGLTGVQKRQIHIPIHTFAGRVGQMGVIDYLAVIEGLKGPLVGQGLVAPEEFDQTIRVARQEMDRYKVMATFPVAFGQRPR